MKTILIPYFSDTYHTCKNSGENQEELSIV